MPIAFPLMNEPAQRLATYQDIVDLPESLVGEILSPSTARIDRALKMPLYAREGVPFFWLVDPDARTLEVYRLQDGGQWLLLTTLKDDDPASQPPFDAITFPLASLWA